MSLGQVSAGDVVAVLRARDEMSAVMKGAVAPVKALGESLKDVGKNISDVGVSITKLTAPLAAAGIASGKLATDFETSTTKIVTLSGVNETAMHGMRQAMLDLAPAVGIGPQALSEAMLVVTSTGIRGAEAMQILEVAAKASAVGLGDTKDVARAITSAMTAYGAENLSAAKAGEILFKTVREGGAEANELAGTLGRVVGIAAQVGVSFDQVGAFMATFTRLGVDSAEAVTALRGVLSTVLKPSKEAREQLAALGFSIDDLRKSIRERGLTESLIELVNRTKGNDDAIGAIIPNVRALAGVLGTAGSQAKAMAEVQKILTTDSDDLMASFKRMSETTGFTFSSLLAQLQKIAIQFGNQLAPSLARLLSAAGPLLTTIEKMVHWFSELSTPVKTAAIAFGAIVTALGPTLFILGQLISSVGTIAGAIGGLLPLLPAFGTAFALATGPVGLIALAVGGLTLAVLHFREQMNQLEHQSTGKAFTAEGKAAEAAAVQARELSKAHVALVGGETAVIDRFKQATTAVTKYTDAQKVASMIADLGAHSVSKLSAEARKYAQAAFAAGVSVSDVVKALVQHNLATDADEAAIRTLHDAYQQHVHDAKEVAKAKETVRLAMVPLNEAQQREAKVLLDLGVSHETIAREINAASIQVKVFEQSLRDLAAVHKIEFGGKGLLGPLGGDIGLAKPLQDLREITKELEKIQHLERGGDRPVGPLGGGIGTVKPSMNDLKGLFNPFTLALSDAMKQAPQIIMNAFTGGGGLAGAAKAAGSLFGSKFMGNLFGEAGKSGLLKNVTGMLGDVLGSAMPIVGSLIGPGIQLLTAGFKKLFGAVSEEEKKGRESVQAFEKQLASTLTATQRLEAGNEQWKMTTIAVRDAYLAQGLSSEQAEAAVKRLWDSSKRGAAETQAAMEAINGVLNQQKQDEADLKAAVQEYHFSIEELGPAMRRQQMSEQAADLFKKFTLLAGSGIDVGVVTDHMSEKLNDYLHLAMKTGEAVPAEWKKIVEQMIQQGLLTDANGEKITDMKDAGITFTETFSQGIDRLINAMKDFFGGVKTGVADAVNSVGNLRDTINSVPRDYTFNAHWNVDEPRRPDFGGEQAAGGDYYVTRPTMFIAGEVPGGERVSFSGVGRGAMSDAAVKELRGLRDDINYKLPALFRNAAESLVVR